MIITFPGWNFY